MDLCIFREGLMVIPSESNQEYFLGVKAAGA